MAEIAQAVRSDLAPNGKLRVGINFGNALLTKRDPNPGGIAVDLARELASRLGVPLEIDTHESAGSLADSASKGRWEVGFLGAEPQRANEIDFTAAYVHIESTYVVPAGSPLKSIADVDREGVRIAVNKASAYDLFLSRSLKNATLVRGESGVDLFVKDKLEVAAGVKQPLVAYAKDHPEVRVMDSHFMEIQQAMGTPKGRLAGAAYLRDFVEDMKASGWLERLSASATKPDVFISSTKIFR